MTPKCVRFISEETWFFRRLLPVCCFHFLDISFPLVIFLPLHSSLSCFLYSVIWCCLADITVAWKGSGVTCKMRIYWSSYAQGTLRLLRLFSSSTLILFVSFYIWCIFVPVPMLTYYLCSECILLKLDLNVTSISSFSRAKFFPLVNSHVWRVLYSALIKLGRIL